MILQSEVEGLLYIESEIGISSGCIGVGEPGSAQSQDAIGRFAR